MTAHFDAHDDESLLREISVSPASLDLTPESIEHRIGYDDGKAPDNVRIAVEEMLTLLDSADPFRCGFRIIEPGHVVFHPDRILCGGVTFETGSIIGRGLKGCTALALLVASAGKGLSERARLMMLEGRELAGYVLDTIASECVERCMDILETELAATAAPRGWRLSNRYSPGYCGWNVDEQGKFFSLLPGNFCGVTVRASGLMVPLKSASAVVGLGANAERKDYECALCDREDCVIRNGG